MAQQRAPLVAGPRSEAAAPVTPPATSSAPARSEPSRAQDSAEAAARAKALAADAAKASKEAAQEEKLRRVEASAAEKNRRLAADNERKAQSEAEAKEREQAAQAARLRKIEAAAERKAHADAVAQAQKQRKLAADGERKAKAEADAKEREEAAQAARLRKIEADADRAAKAQADGQAKTALAQAAAAAKIAAEHGEKQRKIATEQVSLAKAAAAGQTKIAQADAEKQRSVARAEQAVRAKAEAEQLGAAEKIAARQAAAKQALDDRNSTALIEFLVQHPDAPEAVQVFAGLQAVGVEESVNWVSDVQCAASKEFAARRLPPASLQADLAAAKLGQWRSLVPKDLQCTFNVRNPSQHAVVIEFDLAGNRTIRFLTARQTGTVKQTVRCKPDAPVQAAQGETLEYRYGCASQGPSRLSGVRPAAAEMAVDKRAGDPSAPLEVLAKVWQARPASRLGSLYAATVTDRLRRQQEDVSQVSGKATLLTKPVPDQNVPIRVEFRNLAARDLTVLYTVGTGRDERLVLPKGGHQELTVQGRPGQNYEVQVTRILPKLRSVEWLWGSWTQNGARLVLLPDGKGGMLAFPLVVDKEGQRLAIPTAVEVLAGVLRWKTTVDAGFLSAVLAKVPPACTSGCEVAFSAKLSDQDQYTPLGPRVLVLEVQAGAVTAVVKWVDE